MSFTALPQDSLAQIAASLNSTDRQCLRRAFPRALATAFAPTNDVFWGDIYSRRYKARRGLHSSQLHNTRGTQPDEDQHDEEDEDDAIVLPTRCVSSMYERVRMHDMIDDLLLRDGKSIPCVNVWEPLSTPISSSSNHHGSTYPSSMSVPMTKIGTDGVIHMVYGRCYRAVSLLHHSSSSSFYSVSFPSLTDESESEVTTVERSSHVFDVDVTAFDECDGVVAFGLSNGTVMVLSPSHGLDTMKKMRGHTAAITAVLVDVTGGVIASASRDGVVRLRRLMSSSNALSSSSTLRGHGTAVQWITGLHHHHPNMADGEGGVMQQYVTHGGTDGRLKVWDAERRVCVQTVKLSDTITRAAVHQGQVYLSAGYCVYIVDTRLGNGSAGDGGGGGGVACILSLPRAWEGRAHACGCRFGDMAVGTDGTVIASAGQEGLVLWDAKGSWEGYGLGRFSACCRDSRGHDTCLSSVCFAGRYSYLACGGGGHGHSSTDDDEILTFSTLQDHMSTTAAHSNYRYRHTGALVVPLHPDRPRRRRRRRNAQSGRASSQRTAQGLCHVTCAELNPPGSNTAVRHYIVATRRDGSTTLMDVHRGQVDWESVADLYADQDEYLFGGGSSMSTTTTTTTSSGNRTHATQDEDQDEDQIAFDLRQSKRFWRDYYSQRVSDEMQFQRL